MQYHGHELRGSAGELPSAFKLATWKALPSVILVHAVSDLLVSLRKRKVRLANLQLAPRTGASILASLGNSPRSERDLLTCMRCCT